MYIRKTKDLVCLWSWIHFEKDHAKTSWLPIKIKLKKRCTAISVHEQLVIHAAVGYTES